MIDDDEEKMGLVKEKTSQSFTNTLKLARNPRRLAVVPSHFPVSSKVAVLASAKSRNILRTRYLSHVKTNKIQKFLVNKQKTEEENAKMLGIKELMDN